MMYAGAGFSDWEIGDVDVFVEDGVYHLFHLIIPNHDYIAHAVSTDGMSWRRVDNALFVGHPGAWDDDMLWTMHVSRAADGYEMWYTGLKRADRGRVHGIGRAVSRDLMTWTKTESHGWPLYPDGVRYEAPEDCPRGWTSFRDPFHFRDGETEYLLFCARVPEGPTSRRGCVGIARRAGDRYELLDPLLFPRMYDDVECPCLIELDGRRYLIGSIREDIKVRYWFADRLFDDYRSFHADVLLPPGNYAARVVRDENHWLIYSFYYADRSVNSHRVLPPPKQIESDAHGRLVLRTFYRWEQKVTSIHLQGDFSPPRGLLSNPTADADIGPSSWTVGARSGYEVFAFEKPGESLIWDATLTLEGLGKCGLVMDCDRDGNGYFFPFDFVAGLVRVRRWGFNPADPRKNFVFDNLQSNLFAASPDRTVRFSLLRYGNYLELSIDDVVKLTLIDYQFQGPLMGLYSASSVVALRDSSIRVLEAPADEYASPGS